MTRTMTFQPTEKNKAFLKGCVDSGEYQNESEVIREGLRLMMDLNKTKRIEQLESEPQLVSRLTDIVNKQEKEIYILRAAIKEHQSACQRLPIVPKYRHKKLWSALKETQ